MTAKLTLTLDAKVIEAAKRLSKAQGQSISKIGESLSLSVNTISTYRTRIMEKLNIHNNADLVKYAMKHNLI